MANKKTDRTRQKYSGVADLMMKKNEKSYYKKRGDETKERKVLLVGRRLLF